MRNKFINNYDIILHYNHGYFRVQLQNTILSINIFSPLYRVINGLCKGLILCTLANADIHCLTSLLPVGGTPTI